MGRLSALALCSAFLGLAACSGGGPAPGGACQSNRDCVTGETCISGTCRAGSSSGCANDEQCGIGEFCDTASGACMPFTDTSTPTPDAGVGVDAGTSTLTDGGVGRDSGTGQCMVDTDCGTPPVDVCVASQCVKGCGQSDGLPCTGGLVCDMATGHCVSPTGTCQQDVDCNPPTQICEGNMCVFGCGLDSSLCQAGEVCDTNTGRCVVVQTSCTDDAQCNPPMTVCESMQCVPGCDQPGGVQCGGATPFCDSGTGRCTANQMGGCTLDADCMDANLICENMQCVPRCDAPGGGCTPPLVCNASSGRCVSGGLGLGDTCQQDAQCTTGLCLALNLGMNMVSVCTRACGATSQCPIDYTCGDVSGMRFCLSETLNTPAATFDTPANGFCSQTQNTCQSGWCNTGQNQCLEVCSRNADCNSFGGNCHVYEDSANNPGAFTPLCVSLGTANVGQACAANANCRSGVCNRYASVCANTCCSDADCPSTQNCGVYDLDTDDIMKICVNKSGSAGNLALGATCTMPEQCDSEVCVSTNPGQMGAPQRCSTTCCQDSDCNILPGGGVCRPAGGPVMGTIVGVCVPN